MDFRALETFLWVARLRGFRVAAERLNTTQPTVSARIAGLEDELGVRLFERGHRRFGLTPKGRDLLVYAERMIALRGEMIAAVGDPRAIQGSITLGVVESIVHTWLPRLIERVAQAYPAVSLDLDVDTSVNLRKRLVAREIDIAFLMGPITRPEIGNMPLCTYPLSWLVSPRLKLGERPLTLEDLRRIPIITFPRNSRPHLDLEALFQGRGLRPRIHNSSSLATIVRMAIDGIGVCALPVEIVQEQLRCGELRPLATTVQLPELYFTASYPVASDSFVPRAVCDLAVSTARDHMESRRSFDRPDRSQTIRNGALT